MESGLLAQIRKNALALLSLMVALSALSYNTWRNESSEANRNVRAAEFEMLRHLIDVQQVVDQALLPGGVEQAQARQQALNTGLNRVLLIRDLARLTPSQVEQCAEKLRADWVTHSSALEQGKSAAGKAASDQLSEQIWHTREAVLASLRALR